MGRNKEVISKRKNYLDKDTFIFLTERLRVLDYLTRADQDILEWFKISLWNG